MSNVVVLTMDLDAIERVRNASTRGSTFTMYDLIRTAYEKAGEQVAKPGAFKGKVKLEGVVVGTWELA